VANNTTGDHSRQNLFDLPTENLEKYSRQVTVPRE